MTAPSVMADMGRRDSMSGFSGPSETFGTRFGDDDGDGQISGEELARMQGKTYNPNSTVKQVLRMTEKTMPGDIGHLASTGTAEGQSIWNRMARIIQIRDLDLRILMDAHDRRNRGFVEISTFRRSLCYAFGNQWIDLAMSSKEFDEIVQPYLTRRPERPGEPEACVMWQRFANDVQALADTGKRTKNFLDRLEKVERDEKMRRTLAERYAPRNSGAILAQFWRNSGAIRRNSLTRLFALQVPAHEVEKMFVATDVTHTGEIAYTEFIAATLAAQQSITEPTVRTAFSMLDVDGDGVVTKADLMRTVGQVCPEEDVDAMLRGREKLYFQDFLQLMTAGGIVSRNLRAWKRKQLLARRTKSDTDLLSSKSPHPSPRCTSERSEQTSPGAKVSALPGTRSFTEPSAEPPQPSRSVSFTAGTDVRAGMDHRSGMGEVPRMIGQSSRQLPIDERI